MLAILWKDLRIEWRTRESLTAVSVLAVLLLLVFSFAHDPTVRSAAGLAPSVLWVTFIFAGMLGVQRGFLLERENECLAGLLLAPIDAGSIYLGKLVSNMLLLGVLQGLLLPLSVLFLRLSFAGNLLPLLVVLALGNLGFASVTTLFAAVAVRTRAREVMLPLLVLPLLSPLMIAVVQATRAVLGGRGLTGAGNAFGVLVAFDVIFALAGWLLFEYVVRE